uniref:hypothetical protein n=1 Tax=Burkholderia arboris TaxID=488730 RepID=UPI003BEF3667
MRSADRRRAFDAFCAAAVGAAISWCVWRASSAAPTIWLLLALPVLWVRAPSRLAATAMMLGYVLTGTHDIPTIVAGFFPGHTAAFGALLWIVAGLAWTLPWALLWRPAMLPSRAGCRVGFAIWIVSTVPLGFIGWLTPLTLAGVAYPGWGFGGIATTLALFGAAAAVAIPGRHRMRAAAVFGCLAITSAFVNVTYKAPALPDGWRALDMHEGRYPDPADLAARIARQTSLVEQTMRALDVPGTRLLVLPEEIAGVHDALVDASWAHVDQRAREIGATVFVGLDEPIDESAYRDSLIALGAAAPLRVSARVPMLIGQWHPWRSPFAPIDIQRPNTAVIDGRRMRFSFCYEDYLLWLQPWALRRSPPDVLISVANNWFDPGADAQRIQARHIELWARLAGSPLLRATNWGR